MIANNVLELIGNTPLLKIKTPKGSGVVYAKMERNNITGSIKDRAVLGMYEKALNEGLVTENTVFIEATSGNTGISIAMLGSALGNRTILTMPESMSQERRDILKAYGAELVLTPAASGMSGADEKVKELLKEIDNSLQLSQFENSGNPHKHYETTGKEILDDLKEINAFIAGIGTGGTISGVSKYLKENNPKEVLTVGIEPSQSAVITTGKKGPHKIQGIGPGFVPKNLNLDVIDKIETMDENDAISEAKNLIKSDGLFVGVSGAANILSAKKLAENLGSNSVVVTVIPDDGVKYISMGIYN